MGKKRPYGKYALGFIGLVAVIFIANSQGWIDLDNVADVTGDSGIIGGSGLNADTPDNFQVYGNNLNFQTSTKDALDKTIKYGDDTEIDTVCWDPKGSQDVNDWIDLETLSEAVTGDANIDMTAGTMDSDGNILTRGTVEMYCEFNNESSQDYFVDQDQIINNNDRVSHCLWVDATDDDDFSWACHYDLIGITGGDPQPVNEPLETLKVYLFDEDTDGTIIDIVDNTLAGISTGSVTTEVGTHLDIASASADAIVITDIQIINNETSSTESDYSETTELCFDDSEASAVWFDDREPVGCISLQDIASGNIDGRSAGQKIYEASTIEYYANLGSTYKDGILITLPKNAGLQVDTTMRVDTEYSASADGTCWQLGFRYVDAFQNKATFDVVDFETGGYSAMGSVCSVS